MAASTNSFLKRRIKSKPWYVIYISLQWKKEVHVFTIEKQITGFSRFLAKWRQHLFFFIADKTVLNSICFFGCFPMFTAVPSVYPCVFHFCRVLSPSSLSCWICLSEHEISFPRNRKHWIWGKYSHISDTTQLLLLNISFSSALALFLQWNVLSRSFNSSLCLFRGTGCPP